MFKKILLATHNLNKVTELKAMLSPYNIEVLSAADLDLPDVEETGTTFAENASLKAEILSKITSLPCLADDSGLCVDALNGRPGVYSARYAPNRNFDIAMENLLKEISDSGSSNRKAHFSCVLAFKVPQQSVRIFEGRVNGEISFEKKGTSGFGFDPIFIPEGYNQTFAEMSAEQKASLSHRGLALQKFISEVFKTV